MDESNDIDRLILERLTAVEDRLKISNIVVVQKKEEGGETEAAHEKTEWRKVISSISNIGITLIGLLYVGGFFVVNSYLSQYGTYTLSLVQSQYLAAGILVLMMFGFVILSEMAFNRRRLGRLIRVRNWRTTVIATSATGIFAMLLFVLSDRNWLNLLIAFIPFSFLLLGNQIVSVFFWGWVWGKKTVIMPARSGFSVGMLMVLSLITVLGSLYLFSMMTYPLIRPEFGGGAPQVVQFYGSKDGFNQLPLYGIPVTSTVSASTILAENVVSPTYTIPLYLLGETPTSYIVTDGKQEPGLETLLPRARFGVSFQIPKEDVAGILYLGRTDLINPLLVLGYALVMFLALLGVAFLVMGLLWPVVTKPRKTNQ